MKNLLFLAALLAGQFLFSQSAQVLTLNDTMFQLQLEEVLPDGSSFVTKSKPLDTSGLKEVLFNYTFQAYEAVRKAKKTLVAAESKANRLNELSSQFGDRPYTEILNDALKKGFEGKWILHFSGKKEVVEVDNELGISGKGKAGTLLLFSKTNLVLKDFFPTNVELLATNEGTEFSGRYLDDVIVFKKL